MSGYIDPLDALAAAQGIDIDSLGGEPAPPANRPLQTFKHIVDLTEIYGEFYVGLAELLAFVVSEAEVSGALEDYSTTAPVIFGDIVRSIFKCQQGGLRALRSYFPTSTQADEGQAALLLESIKTGCGSQISRGEVASDRNLKKLWFPRDIDIIHTDFPEPFIEISGFAAQVTVWGEVWPKDDQVQEPLSPEEVEEEEEVFYEINPLPRHPHIDPATVMPKIDTSALDDVLVSALNEAPARY